MQHINIKNTDKMWIPQIKKVAKEYNSRLKWKISGEDINPPFYFDLNDKQHKANCMTTVFCKGAILN